MVLDFLACILLSISFLNCGVSTDALDADLSWHILNLCILMGAFVTLFLKRGLESLPK